jgi:hypothetical protein
MAELMFLRWLNYRVATKLTNPTASPGFFRVQHQPGIIIRHFKK